MRLCVLLALCTISNVMSIHTFSNNTNKQHDYVFEENSLSLSDILPIKSKLYDKNRAPKYQGQPTIVYFHVTVLSLDSINEESMASIVACTIMLFLRRLAIVR